MKRLGCGRKVVVIQLCSFVKRCDAFRSYSFSYHHSRGRFPSTFSIQTSGASGKWIFAMNNEASNGSIHTIKPPPERRRGRKKKDVWKHIKNWERSFPIAKSIWFSHLFFAHFFFYLWFGMRYRVIQKKLFHKNEEKMQEKMKMILQKNENLAYIQQQYSVSFSEKIDSKSGFF